MNYIKRFTGRLFIWAVLLMQQGLCSFSQMKYVAADSSLIKVDLTSSDNNDEYVLLLSRVNNAINSDTVANLNLSVFGDGIIKYKHSIDSLFPGKPVLYIDSIMKCWRNPYLIVAFKRNNKEEKFICTITLPNPTAGTSIWISIMPAVASLLGILLGAFFVHVYTKKRDAVRSRFEWNKMLFERYEKAYRDFINNWGGGISATVLEVQFKALQENTIVPHAIRKMYNETVHILNAAASDAHKKAAAEKLLLLVERFIKSPFSF